MNAQLCVLKNFVKHTTFWLINHCNKLVGITNIRHELNDHLKVAGGHIGFGIRPSYRGRGFGNIILKLALVEAKKLGITDVLVTCDQDNLGSIKVIENNRGKTKEEDIFEGTPIYRFWINL